jgi:hypothetical protein
LVHAAPLFNLPQLDAGNDVSAPVWLARLL